MNTTSPSAQDAGLPSEALQRLAAAYGVATDFWDYTGNHRTVPASTIRAVLAALGVVVESEEDVADALVDVELAPWRSVLPPSLVVRRGRGGQVPVHLPHGSTVAVHVALEDGGERVLEQLPVWVDPRDVDGVRTGRATFGVPADLPLGWHEVVAVVEGQEPVRCTLAVTPDVLSVPAAVPERAWGLMAQLYSVRSRTSWGVGDLADLAELGSFFGDQGADFLLINPLHAAEPVGPMTPSPYLPVTRRFHNPLYIRPEDIRECAYLPGPQRALVEWAAEEVRAAAADPSPIDRDAAWSAKRQALEVIHKAGRSPARQRQLDAFRAEEGQGLEDFALWCALSEKYEGQQWPAELDDVSSPAVYRARVELSDRVDYYVWLQWVADTQLDTAQRAAREAGMAMGIMHDLAVGVHPSGADAWSMGDVLARGIGVGAPPDMYNQQGQNWSQPPMRPDALARSGYAPFRDMLRTVLRHAGALRMDHILGLFRLWWIPDGHGADEGTYVRYDHEAMVGVLLLEAQRVGAVVIGEDLGTVEPWVRDYLASRGVLGTSVLWFEKDGDGGPLRPEEYRELVLATVNTHDLPPTAGYLAEEHVDLRERLGLLTDPVPVVRAEARREREKMVARLREYGLLPDSPTERQLVEALHAYVARTPSRFVGVALVDAVGERRAQNQPGTDTEYPNWKLPLADGSEKVVLVEDLPGTARLRSLVAVVEKSLRA
ncbi:4-alpha-glucanotransferase [Georgenia satyanarayanai]|uniref:4-alpha-glucanotransferase n=1 Tax=Georgenia satyanarayanai TaxID=860221 RepID=A0A2Y9AD72_9MICO|nr:4-alpha-glucanotransferase [Georgenia satyanarayanai]PYG00228.1 4-alpha-glucanotransferase [Georgenia satyanarayanai]SSA40529.1 4-alpha-glucanotransferase [Georgenia satyanarayanai]